MRNIFRKLAVTPEHPAQIWRTLESSTSVDVLSVIAPMAEKYRRSSLIRILSQRILEDFYNRSQLEERFGINIYWDRICGPLKTIYFKDLGFQMSVQAGSCQTLELMAFARGLHLALEDPQFQLVLGRWWDPDFDSVCIFVPAKYKRVL